MMDLESPTALGLLAQKALIAMLARGVVEISHPYGWKRPTAWPLPVLRNKSDGPQTQKYRPLVILAYVDGALERLAHPAKTTADDWSDLV